MSERDTQEIAVCVDCLFDAASDGCGNEEQHGCKRDGFAEGWEGWTFDPRSSDESEPFFSWTPCDWCGSHLGGNRYEAVAVRETTTTAHPDH